LPRLPKPWGVAITGGARARPAWRGWSVGEAGRAAGKPGERLEAMGINHAKLLAWLAVAKVAGVAQLAHAPERGQRG